MTLRETGKAILLDCHIPILFSQLHPENLDFFATCLKTVGAYGLLRVVLLVLVLTPTLLFSSACIPVRPDLLEWLNIKCKLPKKTVIWWLVFFTS